MNETVHKIDTGYRPHHVQSELHASLASHRFAVVVAHRRMGKTVWAVNTCIHAALTTTRSDARFAYIAPYFRQSKQVAWDYFKQFCHMIPGISFNESELRIDFPNGSRIRLYGGDNPDSLRGIYLDGVVLDEVADMRPNVWGEVIRPTLADRKGWAIFIGTPKGINLFYEMYQTSLRESDWFSGIFRATDTGLIDDGELEAARKSMTEQEFAQEFLCDFTANKGNVLIPIGLSVEASKRDIHDMDVKGAVRVLGVDVARYGEDNSVIFPVVGLKAYDPLVFDKISNVDLAQQLIRKIDDFEPDFVRVDAGRGEGVIDYLRSHGYSCTEVNFGGRPRSNYYSNARAEMWDGTKKWLESGGCIPDLPKLVSELSTPEFEFNPSNKMVIESKEKMRKRGMGSPDYADALALAVGLPLQRSGHSGGGSGAIKKVGGGLKTMGRFVSKANKSVLRSLR